MKSFRRLVALGMCVWLLVSGGAAYALVSMEAEHEHEHAAMGYKAHDAGDHRHADDGIELFSQLFGQSGFDQLTSAWIMARGLVASQDVAGVAPVHFPAEPASVTPIPPPGPPPRAVALNGGGGFPR